MFEETKKGGSKKTTATTAPKKEVNENEEEEVPTPKRKRIWEHSTELTDEFLVKEIGINSRFVQDALEKLRSQGVESVGSLLGLSKEELGNAVGLPMGSVSAIMEFIRQQKGKRLKSEEQSKQKLTIPKINKVAEQFAEQLSLVQQGTERTSFL